MRQELADTFPNVELLTDQSSLQRELDQVVAFMVRSDGSVSGYRRGTERKLTFLAEEHSQ